jgi:two-component system nitrogen regulation sensor histidine kinase GlnL
VQIAPLADKPDHVLVLLENRELAGRLDRAMHSKSAAKSAIGMAEMLAHEIKNPLAGITGAAQLISMNASGEERELTDLIVAETRRILKLLEPGGGVRQCPPARTARGQHPRRARPGAEIGRHRFCRAYGDRGRLRPVPAADLGRPRPVQQVFLNLLKNAAEAGREGGTIRIRTFYELSLKVRRRDGTGGAVPLQVEITDDGPGIPPDMPPTSSSPSCRAARTARGWALRSSPRSFPTTTAGSRWTPSPGAPFSAFPYPSRRARSVHDRAGRPDDRSILTWTVPFSSPMTTARSARF